MIEAKFFTDATAEDMRVESFLAELLSKDSSVYEVLIYPKGGFERSYARDMAVLKPADLNEHEVSKQVIEVNRNGLYDNTPEALWHSSMTSSKVSGVAGMRDLVARNREITRKARKFCWPVDNEFLYTRARIRAFERDSILGFGNARMKNPLNRFWRPYPELSTNQRVLMILLSPMTHMIRRKNAWVESTLKLFMDCEVRFEKGVKTIVLQNEKATHLGDAALGIDTVMSGVAYETVATAFITLKEIQPGQFKDFLPGNKSRLILEYILAFLLPCDIEVEIDLEPNSRETLLGNEHSAHLGYARLSVT